MSEVKTVALWDQICEVVEAWHGKDVFDLYRDHSPEMKRIREGVESAEARAQALEDELGERERTLAQQVAAHCAALDGIKAATERAGRAERALSELATAAASLPKAGISASQWQRIRNAVAAARAIVEAKC